MSHFFTSCCEPLPEKKPLLDAEAAPTTESEIDYALINQHIGEGTCFKNFDALCRKVPFLSDLWANDKEVYVTLSLLTGVFIIPLIHIISYYRPSEKNSATSQAYQQIHAGIVNNLAQLPMVNKSKVESKNGFDVEVEKSIPFTIRQNQSYEYRIKQVCRQQNRVLYTQGSFFKKENNVSTLIEKNIALWKNTTASTLAANFFYYGKDPALAASMHAFIEEKKSHDNQHLSSIASNLVKKTSSDAILRQFHSVEVFSVLNEQDALDHAFQEQVKEDTEADLDSDSDENDTVEEARQVAIYQKIQIAAHLEERTYQIRDVHLLRLQTSNRANKEIVNIYKEYCNQIKQAASRSGIDRVIFNVDGLYQRVNKVIATQEQQWATLETIGQLFADTIMEISCHDCFNKNVAYWPSSMRLNSRDPDGKSSASGEDVFWGMVNKKLEEMQKATMEKHKEKMMPILAETSPSRFDAANQALQSQRASQPFVFISSLEKTGSFQAASAYLTPKDLLVCDSYTEQRNLSKGDSKTQKNQPVFFTELKENSTLAFLDRLVVAKLKEKASIN